MDKMSKKEKVLLLIGVLKSLYPEVWCELDYEQPHELLIATRLSAQCTDKRVNMVTPQLFQRFRSVDEFAGADVGEVEKIVRTCGLFKTKARDIVLMCQMILSDFDGGVPDSIEALLRLPGVGRKTANLIMGELYGQPAIVTDTHVIRLSNRLGLCDTTDPQKVEVALRGIVPPDESMAFCHRLVWHGRRVCVARKPKCEECLIACFCDGY